MIFRAPLPMLTCSEDQVPGTAGCLSRDNKLIEKQSILGTSVPMRTSSEEQVLGLQVVLDVTSKGWFILVSMIQYCNVPHRY